MSFWPIPIAQLDVYLFLASALALVTWLYLSFGHGRFWYTDQRLGRDGPITFNTTQWPTVVVVIPDRNKRMSLSGRCDFS